MSDLIKYREHFEGIVQIDNLAPDFSKEILFIKRRNEERCLSIKPELNGHRLQLSYYIGVDWIDHNKAIYVEPKLNACGKQTDYIKMLFSALSHSEIKSFTDELYELKWDSPQIEITQKQDLLTPLLVIQFLRIVQEIVRTGLKKSYYKVENNHYCKVKGKILTGKTIKQNLMKYKLLNTYCSYEEFGINNPENRLIKRALVFVQKYIPALKFSESNKYASTAFNYIMPAFQSVTEEVCINDLKNNKNNVFYREYETGIQLAKLILQRFGYNLSNTQNLKIKTPPFWIDMSKLFELYVLGLLKERFKNNELHYHFSTCGNELDYLINSEEYQMVVDAKYKPAYQTENNGAIKENIRQISGYARLEEVYKKLNKSHDTIIDCLIIYPDQFLGLVNLRNAELKENPIERYVHFYKIPVRLPELS